MKRHILLLVLSAALASKSQIDGCGSPRGLNDGPIDVAANFKAWHQGIGGTENELGIDNNEEDWVKGLSRESLSELVLRLRNGGGDEDAIRRELALSVTQMGKSPSYDFRLLYLGWDYLSPVTIFQPADQTKNDEVDWLESAVAEAQVKLWINHPIELERYVWFVTWCGYFDRTPERIIWLSEMIREGFDRNDPSVVAGTRYWLYARAFMFASCMTNRNDFFLDQDSSKLREPALRWFRWMKKTVESRALRSSGFSPSWVSTLPADLANAAVKSEEPLTPIGDDESEENSEEFIFPKLQMVPQYPLPHWRDGFTVMSPVEFRESHK